MKITKIDNVYQLSFLPHLFPINVYVVEEEKSLTVIDIGMKPFNKELKKLSTQLGKPIENLLLTHAHSDHVMGIHQFKALFPDVVISMSEREHRFIKEDFKFDADEAGYELKGDYSKCNFEVDHLLKEGEHIGSLQVINTPGHSVGSISFWNSDNGFLIAGDSFQTKGRVAVSGDKVMTFPFPAIATGNKEAALKSAIKIKDLKPRVLAVGHGKMIEQPQTMIEKAIKRCEDERENQSR
ncbi:MBL fold metallo-hydrolase [Macrococcus lamae]|uniref:MBL fold metallo-hydrolase n=1 Tax=Macrococcus lamae TaxID=198484 RepID=A0A4R6BT53_9STAP|nr:MBL fold metallo-hydrolase [Macrococcus lamae]TDM07500.1 MBL fold metallo-hydrolase [Macrococcus lamae]